MNSYNSENATQNTMDDPIIQKSKKTIGRKAKQTMMELARMAIGAIKKAIFAIIKVLLPYILIITGILMIVIISYFIIFEFTGTEKEYIKEYENELIIDENNMMIATENTMNIQNKVVRDFYKFFSEQSYWKLVKNKDGEFKLISPIDEDRNNNRVEDYYKRENTFKLGLNFLFSFDRFIYKEDWKYPEQIIKPVCYDKETLTLETIVDEEGFVIVESDEEDIKTGEKTGNKIFSIRDYGLASILVYNNTEDWKRTLKVKGTYTKKDIWDSSTKSVITVDINENFDLIMHNYPKDIDLIDKVITFKGDIEYEYEYKETKYSDLTPGQTSDEREPKTEYLYDIYYEPIYEEYIDKNGEIKERIIDHKPHKLYKYRSEDSAIMEELPVITNTRVEDVEDEYLNGYIYNFESYIPVDTVNDFEFTDRIDYDSYIFDYDAMLVDDYGFDLGSAIEEQRSKFENALQYFDIIKEEANYFGVDPYIILAMMTQESGGKYDYNSDGIMQIGASKTGERTISTTNSYGDYEVVSIKNNERLDVQKSVRFATAYFKYLLELMNGDPYKAIQSYNLGEGTMLHIRDNYPEAWNSNFGWLIYREWARQKNWPTLPSASYG